MQDTTNYDDITLLKAWHTGSAQAQGTLYRRYYPIFSRYFERRVRPQDVAELIHMTWEAVGKAVREPRGLHHPLISGSPTGDLRGWFLKFAYFEAMHYYRRNRRDAGVDPKVDTLASLMPSLSSQFARADRRERLELALHGLPLIQHMIVEYIYRYELTTRDVALVLEVPEGTVRSALARARRTLGKLLNPDRGEPRPPIGAATDGA